MIRSKLFWILSSVGALIFSTSAGAQDLLVDTTVGVDIFYDDQFETLLDDSDTSGIVYLPSIDVGYEAETYQSVLSFGAAYNRYENSELGDRDNFRANWDQRFAAEQMSFAFNIGYNEELVEAVSALDDSVSVSNNDEVKTFYINPSAAFDLSSTSRLDVAYSYEDNSIDTGTAELGGVTQGVSGTWFRDLSQSSTFGVYLFAEEYQPEDLPDGSLISDSKIYGAAVGGSYQLSAQWALEGSLGLSEFQVDDAAVGDDMDAVISDGDSIFTANLTAIYEGQVDTVVVGVEAGTVQQLDGVVDDQQSLVLSWDRNISDVLSTRFGARFLQAERDDREDFSAELAVLWQQSEKLQYGLAYRYREDSLVLGEIGAASISGNSNRIVFSIQYSFDQMKFDI